MNNIKSHTCPICGRTFVQFDSGEILVTDQMGHVVTVQEIYIDCDMCLKIVDKMNGEKEPKEERCHCDAKKQCECPGCGKALCGSMFCDGMHASDCKGGYI